MNIYELLQSMPRPLALRLMKLYPGITKLKFLQKKLSRSNGVLSKLRYYIPIETYYSLTIYYSLFQYIFYDLAIWCYTSKENITKIFILQKIYGALTFFRIS